MTTKQKAEVYDKAINIAKSKIKNDKNHILYEEDIIDIFPELKESENEKIRNFISNELACLRATEGKGSDRYEKLTNAIAWLEKQDEKTSDKIVEKARTEKQRVLLTETDGSANIDWDCRSLDDVKALLKCGLEFIRTIEANKQILTDSRFGGCSSRIPTRYDKGIKQGEQNAVKVNPKFHEGEWITNGEYTWKIIEVKPLDYILQSQDGNIVDDTTSHVDEQFHSFTIEDAKDGDVLAAHEYIVLFKEIDGLNIKCHCTYNFMNNPSFYVNTLQNKSAFHPATKEQRDLLFQKIKEAGYEWNAKKKKLKTTVVPTFNIGDTIIKRHNSDINKFGPFIITDITGGKYWYNDIIICDITEQNDWELANRSARLSEEDEQITLSIEQVMNCASLLNIVPGKIDKIKSWLKSLKHRNM